MHQSLLTVSIIGYVAATGLALAYLVQREELVGDALTEEHWYVDLPAL